MDVPVKAKKFFDSSIGETRGIRLALRRGRVDEGVVVFIALLREILARVKLAHTAQDCLSPDETGRIDFHFISGQLLGNLVQSLSHLPEVGRIHDLLSPHFTCSRFGLVDAIRDLVVLFALA